MDERIKEYEQLWSEGYTKFVPDLLEYTRNLENKAQELEEEIERTDNSLANAYMQYQKQYERVKELEKENKALQETSIERRIKMIPLKEYGRVEVGMTIIDANGIEATVESIGEGALVKLNGETFVWDWERLHPNVMVKETAAEREERLKRKVVQAPEQSWW
ncbi:hypothetical protein GCM10008931_39110 [Oceanobacillus oncorhynchi subsp. oncorhynchi]|uniref:hypothetical protein n=1 Tax=Oceanobacillus oncorhynchi TaxID=545501 RepID=UPI0031CEC4CF